MKTCAVVYSVESWDVKHSTTIATGEFVVMNGYIDLFYKQYKCYYGHITYMCIKCEMFILHKPSYAHMFKCFHECPEDMYMVTLPVKEYIRQYVRGGQTQEYISKNIYVSELTKHMQHIICLRINIMDPSIVNIVDECDLRCDFDGIDYIDQGDDIYPVIFDIILDKSTSCVFCGNVFDSFPTREVISSHLVSPNCISTCPLVSLNRIDILKYPCAPMLQSYC